MVFVPWGGNSPEAAAGSGKKTEAPNFSRDGAEGAAQRLSKNVNPPYSNLYVTLAPATCAAKHMVRIA